jgi:hypothetical protein
MTDVGVVVICLTVFWIAEEWIKAHYGRRK